VIRFRALAVLLLVAGCSSGPVVLSPDGDYFEGLDPAVVEEVLASPVAVSQINQDCLAEEDYERSGQAVVLRYTYCRELLRVYEEWLTTGTQPEWHSPTMPTFPRVGTAGYPIDEGWDLILDYTEEVLASGDIELLRFELVNPNGTCAPDPAKPGDINGPTIADVVKGMG